MMSIRTTLRSGVLSISSMACRPLVAVSTSMSWFSSTRREREDVACVVVDDQDFFAAQHVVRPMQPLEHLALRFGQVRHDAVQEQRRLVEEPLWGLHVLEHDALRDTPQSCFLASLKLLAGEDDDGQCREAPAPPACVPAARIRSCPAA